MTLANATRAALVMLALYAAMFLVQPPPPTSADGERSVYVVDYVAQHAAGRLALEGRPRAAYDVEVHRAVQDATVGRDSEVDLPYAYPPTYFMVATPFALLPYPVGMWLFPLLTLGLFGLVAGRIVGHPAGTLWMLATPPVLWCLAAGQNGFLNAALLGASLAILPTRPILAGVLVGLLSYKPHLGLVIPFALAAAGQWRAFGAAAASTVGSALLALAVFGLAPWPAFIGAVDQFGGFVLSSAYEEPWRLQSLYGTLRALSAPPPVAIGAQVVFTGVVVGLTAGLWRMRDMPYELKAAGLSTAAVLASPYLFIYDMPVLTIAVAFVTGHALQAREPSLLEITALLAANVVIFAYPAGSVARGVPRGDDDRRPRVRAVATGTCRGASAGPRDVTNRQGIGFRAMLSIKTTPTRAHDRTGGDVELDAEVHHARVHTRKIDGDGGPGRLVEALALEVVRVDHTGARNVGQQVQHTADAERAVEQGIEGEPNVGLALVVDHRRSGREDVGATSPYRHR